MDFDLERIKRYFEQRGIVPIDGGAEDAPIGVAERKPLPTSAPVALGSTQGKDPMELIKRELAARGLLRQAGAGDEATMRSEMAATQAQQARDESRANMSDLMDSSHFTYGRGATPWRQSFGAGDRQAQAQQQIRDYLLKKQGQDDALIGKAFDARPDNSAYNMAELERRKAADADRAAQGARGADLRGRELDIKEQDLLRKKNAPPRPPKGAADPSGLPMGFELDPESHATKEQNRELAGLVAADKRMRGMTTEMRQLLAQAGAGRLIPGANSRIKQLATEMKIEGKNIANLGALSGPDMGLMDAIVADPSKLGSLAKDMGVLLDGLDSWGKNSVDATASTIGARSKDGAKAQSAGVVVVRRKRDGMTQALDAARAQKYLADPGFEVVK